MSVLSLPNMAAPFSAFRSVPSRTANDGLNRKGLVPIDAMLIPAEFITAFSIPVVSFDQREAPATRAVLKPPFELPLAFAESELPPPRTQTDDPVCSAGHSPSAAPHCNPIQAHVVSTSSGADHAKPLHKPRVVWTDELHQRFLRAIDAAGSDEAAVPTVILKLMNVSGLSRDNVASHLQKHRLGLKRGKSRKRRSSTLQGPRSKVSKSHDATVGELWEQDGTPVPGEVATVMHDRDTAKSCDASNPAGSEMPVAAPSREGDGNDCEGSNERDDCDANEGPGSDDGAGAGSDNRTACNASGMDVGEMAPHGSHAGGGHGAGAEGQGGVADTGRSESPVAADGAPGSSGDGSQERKHAGVSPFHSRSGSNHASKQQNTSNGASRANGSGSEPTEGSRTAGAGQSTNKQAVQPTPVAQSSAQAVDGGLAAAGMVSTPLLPVSASHSAVTQSNGAQKSGGWYGRSLVPVGIPLRLPSDIQVPLGNTERICAPRTGDGA